MAPWFVFVRANCCGDFGFRMRDLTRTNPIHNDKRGKYKTLGIVASQYPGQDRPKPVYSV